MVLRLDPCRIAVLAGELSSSFISQWWGHGAGGRFRLWVCAHFLWLGMAYPFRTEPAWSTTGEPQSGRGSRQRPVACPPPRRWGAGGCQF